MEYKYYEKKINDVILKCPIEAGVEILVYNLLDSIMGSEKISLVDINRLQRDRDQRLTTQSGIADIAIVSEDFRYRMDIGRVYGFIEVKATGEVLHETEQINGQKTKARHCLYTNGLVWKYFKDGKYEWQVSLAYYNGKICEKMPVFQSVSINENAFNELKDKLSEIHPEID